MYRRLTRHSPIPATYPKGVVRHPQLLIIDTTVQYERSWVPGTIWWVIGYSVGADRYLTMVSSSS